MAGTGAAVLAHATPALASLRPLRLRLAPGLAGIGRCDHVALTFDDGPDPRSTPKFAALLAAHDVKATFFLLGTMLAKQPALGRDLVDAGHELAVHGWSHTCLLRRGPRATIDDITRAYDLVADVCGSPPLWYRPPYGLLTTAALVAARRLGMTPVLWTAWGRDWTARATPASVLDTVERQVHGGGTVLLHDSDCTSATGAWRSAYGAVPALIHGLRARRLEAGPLRDHGLRVQDFGPPHEHRSDRPPSVSTGGMP